MDYSEGLFATYNSSLQGGYINTKGETVIPFKYGAVGAFKNGYAVVFTLNHEPQVIDKTGRTVMRITDLYKNEDKNILCETPNILEKKHSGKHLSRVR